MSEQQLECINKIILCLEQKNLFITTILDITKQLEVKTQNETIDFEDLLEKRGDTMARIDKCKAMEKNVLASLSDADKADIVDALEGGTAFHNNNNLNRIVDLSNSYASSLNALAVADKTATEMLKQRYEIAKSQVSNDRPLTGSMFSR